MFYNEGSSLDRHIAKLNVRIIGRDMNAHVVKDGNYKFSRQNLPNRIGEYLAVFAIENRPVCRNTKFQIRQRKIMNLFGPKQLKRTA